MLRLQHTVCQKSMQDRPEVETVGSIEIRYLGLADRQRTAG
jgi:hypothetical protein